MCNGIDIYILHWQLHYIYKLTKRPVVLSNTIFTCAVVPLAVGGMGKVEEEGY